MHDFYCTNCGRKLTQGATGKTDALEVLFDLQYVFTKDTNKRFAVLKYRMPYKDFMALYQSGTPEGKFRNVTLTLEQFFKTVANDDNLRDARVANITLEDIENALNTVTPQFDSYYQESDSSQDDLGALEGSEGSSFVPQGVAEASKPSEAMEALLKKDIKNTSNEQSDITLEDDLRCIKNAFENGGTCTFALRLLTEHATNGGDVVVGYQVSDLMVGEHAAPRVCPHRRGEDRVPCDYPVFDFAGTSEHHRIVFFGPQHSGKTSLIIALTDYAENGMRHTQMSPLWHKAHARTLPVKQVTLLDNIASPRGEREEKLQQDLKWYAQGIAPAKTDANGSKDAYSATFRIQDMQEKFHLLTLTDVPGELVEERGYLNLQKLLRLFPTALSCDAYVICFNTRALNIQETLVSADNLQKLHMNDYGGYLPMIIVYTQCKELEDAARGLLEGECLPSPGPKDGDFTINKLYMFCNEKENIEQTPSFQSVLKDANDMEHLRHAYKAAIRCSAYGYPAPAQRDIDDKGKETTPISDTLPIYVDYLMEWLLSVSGCMPVQGKYQPTYDKDRCWVSQDNYLDRVQHRSEPAQSDQEALARGLLFVNPTELDTLLVTTHGNFWERKRSIATYNAKKWVKSLTKKGGASHE